jgi:LPXTG-motif cell wall-anchored protein
MGSINSDALIAIGTVVLIGLGLLISIIKHNHENKKNKK